MPTGNAYVLFKRAWWAIAFLHFNGGYNMLTNVQEQILDYETAAIFLGMAEPTLRKRVSRREIPHVKLGRLVRFRMSDLHAHLEANAIPAEV
jgi:excisionase family DNA binding protein